MGILHYPHRVTIRKYIISNNFSLGVGCVVTLDLASKQLVKLLRAVYYIDSDALGLSGASKTYLLGENKNLRRDSNIPCISITRPICCYQPKILSSEVVHGK